MRLNISKGVREGSPQHGPTAECMVGKAVQKWMSGQSGSRLPESDHFADLTTLPSILHINVQKPGRRRQLQYSNQCNRQQVMTRKGLGCH